MIAHVAYDARISDDRDLAGRAQNCKASILFKMLFYIRRYFNFRTWYIPLPLGTMDNCIIEFFAHCKGGNFNIHIRAWIGYFIC